MEIARDYWNFSGVGGLGEERETVLANIVFPQIDQFRNCLVLFLTSPTGETVRNLHWKVKNICFSLKVPIQHCRPKSDLASSGAIWAQFKPRQKPMAALADISF